MTNAERTALTDTARAVGERWAIDRALCLLRVAMRHLRSGDAAAASRSMTRVEARLTRDMQRAEDVIEMIGAIGLGPARFTPRR